MKLTKLLAATSAAALMAGAAHAQLALKQEGAAAGDIAAPYEIADEVDFAALAAAPGGLDEANFGLRLQTLGTIPPGQNLFVTFNVTGAEWSESLDGSEFTAGTTGAVVTAGGGDGDSSVTYLITTDTFATGGPPAYTDSVSISLPVRATGCNAISFSVTNFRTESGGTAIETGSASLTDVSGDPLDALTCVSAYAANVTADSPSDTFLDFATDFRNFVDTTALVPAGNDTLTFAQLGTVAFTVDASVNIDMNGTPASAGDVDGFDMDVTFANGDGIVSVEVNTGNPGEMFDGISANVVADAAAVGAALSPGGNEAGGIGIIVDGATTVAAQAVTVSNAVLNLDTALSLKATDAFTTQTAEPLVYNGKTFGPFDWVNSEGAVNSIFRITGLPQADVTGFVVLENSTAGAAFDKSYPFTISAADIANGEERITSKSSATNLDLVEIVGSTFGTADVTFVLSTGATLDIDRLNSSASTAVVTPYGDNANSGGPGDAVAQP